MILNLDRRSKLSLAIQIESLLRHQILKENLSNGAVLKSSEEMANYLKVDETDVLEAYQQLIKDHLVEKVKHQYVVRKLQVPKYLFDEVNSIYSLIKNVGYQPSIATYDIKVIETPEFLSEAKDLKQVLSFKRIYSGDTKALFYMECYLAIKDDSFQKKLLENQPYYELLNQDYGLKIKYSTRTIEAKLADAEKAKALKIIENSALVFSKAVSYDQNNSWFECIYSYSLPSIMHFTHSKQ